MDGSHDPTLDDDALGSPPRAGRGVRQSDAGAKPPRHRGGSHCSFGARAGPDAGRRRRDQAGRNERQQGRPAPRVIPLSAAAEAALDALTHTTPRWVAFQETDAEPVVAGVFYETADIPNRP